MRRKSIHLAAIGIFMAIGMDAAGADLALSGGDVGLTISTAAAGQQPDAVTDESTQLDWTTLVSDPTKKIVVQTGLVSPLFTLSVQALNISSGDGTSAGEVTLGSSPTDFIVSIPADIPPGDPGTCTLHYSASATAAEGSGSDVHTITFTIVDQ